MSDEETDELGTEEQQERFNEIVSQLGVNKEHRPRVLNKRTDVIPPDAVYVGRPSKWGNPYQIGISGNRHEVIQFYREDLEDALEDNPHYLDELQGKDLVCWCAPLPCHADILLELANVGRLL